MILSASTRCDIPAFYFDWFLNRLKEGFVDVRNPFNPKLVNRILLNPQDVECIIFYTKNPIPVVEKIAKVFPYNFYIHITINGYGKEIEPNVPDKKDIIEATIKLSKLIGKERITLRYNPIFLNKKYTMDYHIRAFEKLCSILHPYVDRVIMGFIDMYKNTNFHQSECQFHKPTLEEEHYLAKEFGFIAQKYQLSIQTCSRHDDFSKYGFLVEACNSSNYLNKRLNNEKKYKKTKVRKECSCIESADIGVYNSCTHYCKYCYANFDELQINYNVEKHNPRSSLLFGDLKEDDVIKIRK